MTDIAIRAAEESDAEAIHDIMSCPRVMANTLQLPWRPLEWHREWLRRLQSDGHLLVAVVEGRVVGNIGLEIVRAARRRDVGSIGMSVHDDYQNRGIGGALMVAVIQLADDWLGLRRLELEVWTDNLAAIHLYEKFGFVIEGTGRQFARRAGTFVDAHYMGRLKARTED
jgi:putative acetyltransferase